MTTINKLYYGDNLDICKNYIPDESVDLIYLDPPFNSKANYNLLFKTESGKDPVSQVEAFNDFWIWDQKAEETYKKLVTESPKRISDLILTFRSFLGENAMMAYVVMMAIRLLELHRVLKSSGSIYLHCDPTASHYLKMIMDGIFGPTQFRNEIIWRRTGAHNKVRRFGPIHDTILFYSKTNEYFWSYPKKAYMKGHIEQNFIQDEKGYRTNYYGNVLTGSGIRNGDSGKPWKGIDPTTKGRHWAIPGALLEDIDKDFSNLTQHQKLDKLLALGYIKFQPGKTWPVYEHYIKESDGQPIPDIWAFQPYTEGTVFRSNEGIDSDVRWLSPKDQERLGYQTQKPEGLLKRIILASCDPNGTVLDPFCGCGTTIAVAESLKRNWIGIDITQVAIQLIIETRLKKCNGSYEVIGIPKDERDAKALALQDPFEFQYWALRLISGKPVGDKKKKGADQGIDGTLNFYDGIVREFHKTLISVKSGNVNVSQIRDLRGVIERENADFGIFITLKKPTKPMIREALRAGFVEFSTLDDKLMYPRIQILTIGELLKGADLKLPFQVPISSTDFKPSYDLVSRQGYLSMAEPHTGPSFEGLHEGQ